jgi:sugar (pentulose or hexulose) kinase
MPALRRADEALATIRPAVAAATGLPADCAVLAGLHDSNAALLALRGHADMTARDATVLSTGTWFVAMRSLSRDAEFFSLALDEARDCLLNVDVHGRPVPSARFMGGRDAELIRGTHGGAFGAQRTTDALLQRVAELLAQGARVYPSFVAGVGPYPDAVGSLRLATRDPRDWQIMASLYLALMADTALDLIGSHDGLFVEGPFASDELFVRALASLRPRQAVHTCDGRHDLAYGALRLVAPELAPPAPAVRVRPLELDLAAFADDWRQHARGAPNAATIAPMSAER